ncbi:uncharacterized protein LOC129595070 [Paramacrobiotus metropolitanus]|uniref:uncharacterized protein LOC129595070 n=1 Tax=Paramacrobiotus metropolitanus TaxID=2943436 RepID=UPI0024460B13|nr:uncharacterized protein LOC129595070 [Paramacrobiotus metropolitanus]
MDVTVAYEDLKSQLKTLITLPNKDDMMVSNDIVLTCETVAPRATISQEEQQFLSYQIPEKQITSHCVMGKSTFYSDWFSTIMEFIILKLEWENDKQRPHDNINVNWKLSVFFLSGKAQLTPVKMQESGDSIFISSEGESCMLKLKTLQIDQQLLFPTVASWSLQTLATVLPPEIDPFAPQVEVGGLSPATYQTMLTTPVPSLMLSGGGILYTSNRNPWVTPRICFVFEQVALNIVLTAKENVDFVISRLIYTAREMMTSAIVRKSFNAPHTGSVKFTCKNDPQNTLYASKSALGLRSSILDKHNIDEADDATEGHEITSFDGNLIAEMFVFCECRIAPNVSMLYEGLCDAAHHYDVEDLTKLCELYLIRDAVALGIHLENGGSIAEFTKFLDICRKATALDLELLLMALHIVVMVMEPKFMRPPFSKNWTKFIGKDVTSFTSKRYHILSAIMPDTEEHNEE